MTLRAMVMLRKAYARYYSNNFLFSLRTSSDFSGLSPREPFIRLLFHLDVFTVFHVEAQVELATRDPREHRGCKHHLQHPPPSQ